MRHLPGVIFLLLAFLPFALRPGGGGIDADVPDGEVEAVVIVSPHRRELREEYARAFSAYMARVHGRRARVAWRDPGGGTEAILKDLEARYGQEAGPGADLFFGGGVIPHIDAKNKGWLAPVGLPEESLRGIPPAVAGQPVYDPDGYWYGVALASFGIIYDADLVAGLGLPPPREWEDLGEAAYAGWLAGGNPQTSGVVHTCYQTILQAYGFDAGWRLLARMAANTRIFGEGASVAPTEVAAGDAAAGMAIENYADTVIRDSGNPALGFVLPEGLTLVNADAISLLRDGPNPELARRFVAFCLSEEGQLLLIRPAGVEGQLYSQRRCPVRADLYAGEYAPAINPYAGGGGFVYDNAAAALRRRVLNDMAGTWLIDTHPYLSAAWRAVIARGMRPEEVDYLTAPPLDGGSVEVLGRSWQVSGDDLAERERVSRERVYLRREWALAARERYRAVAAGRFPWTEGGGNGGG